MATGKFLNHDITPEGKTKKIRPEKILNGLFISKLSKPYRFWKPIRFRQHCLHHPRHAAAHRHCGLVFLHFGDYTLGCKKHS